MCIIFPDITYFDMCGKEQMLKLIWHIFNYLWRALTNLIGGYDVQYKNGNFKNFFFEIEYSYHKRYLGGIQVNIAYRGF